MSPAARPPGDGPANVGVLTVPGDGSAGEAGERLVGWVRERGHRVAVRRSAEASRGAVVRGLLSLIDETDCDVVLTAGGVGLGERDVVPEATRAVLERGLPGIAERLRDRDVGAGASGALERGTAGVRGRTLVVNLPGSLAGVEGGLEVLDPLLEPAVEALRRGIGEPEAGTTGA